MALSMMRTWLAAALCAAALPGAAHASTLSVCIDKSSASAAMDHKVAEAVATTTGATLSVFEYDGGAGGDDDGMPQKAFRTLAEQKCDLVLGFPLDHTKPVTPAALAATTAYAQVGFVLVTHPGTRAQTLVGFPKGTDIGVTYLTTPNLYFADHPNVVANIFDTEQETLRAFLTHGVKAAMLWRPTVVGYEASHPHARLAVHDLTEPHARFDIVALYAAPKGDAAAQQFAGAIARLRASGTLAGLVAPYAELAAASAAPVRHAEAAAPPLVLALAEADQPPALYTAQQAADGAQLFAANCALCHGKDLTGLAGPALKGKNFASAKAAFHVSDVFRILSNNMPATQPASLPRDTYVKIMAFLLQQNGYPSGSQQLTFDSATNSPVPLLYHGP